MPLKMDALVRLSQKRQKCIITLELAADSFGSDNLEQVYAAVNEGFFEKASDVIKPYSPVLAGWMEKGA